MRGGYEEGMVFPLAVMEHWHVQDKEEGQEGIFTKTVILRYAFCYSISIFFHSHDVYPYQPSHFDVLDFCFDHLHLCTSLHIIYYVGTQKEYKEVKNAMEANNKINKVPQVEREH